MTTATATPVRLPQGNSGREYAVTDTGDSAFPVRVEPMTGRRALPSAAAELQARDARALGVQLIELAGYAAAGIDDPRPPMYRVDDTFYVRGGRRGYRAGLRGVGPAGTNTRRVRLFVTGSDGEILPSLSDAFSAADARALGVALIAAAGAQ